MTGLPFFLIFAKYSRSLIGKFVKLRETQSRRKDKGIVHPEKNRQRNKKGSSKKIKIGKIKLNPIGKVGLDYGHNWYFEKISKGRVKGVMCSKREMLKRQYYSCPI